MQPISPEAGPSRSLKPHASSSPLLPRRRKRWRPTCTCWLLAAAATAANLPVAVADSLPTSPVTKNKRSQYAEVAPLYTYDGSHWVRSHDWVLAGKRGSDFAPEDDLSAEEGHETTLLPSTTATATQGTLSESASTTNYSKVFYNGKRDRTPVYAVPVIIVMSIIIFAVIMAIVPGSALYYKKRKARRRRQRAIEADEGYGEEPAPGDSDSDDEFKEKEKPIAPKKLRWLRTKPMIRFRGQRTQVLLVHSSGIQPGRASLRQRRTMPAASRSSLVSQTGPETDSGNEPLTNRAASPAPSASTVAPTGSSSDPPQSVSPGDEASGPPAYANESSPRYNRQLPPTARQLEKRRIIEDPPSEEHLEEAEPPHLAEDEASPGITAHVATDDKAVLEAMRNMSSMPEQLPAEAVPASAPDDELGSDGFEPLPLQEESAPPSAPKPMLPISSPFPAPPPAIRPSFTGMAAEEDASAPSAPDFESAPDSDREAEDASAPSADDLEGVIRSTGSVGWLPIYEASSSTRQGHGVV